MPDAKSQPGPVRPFFRGAWLLTLSAPLLMACLLAVHTVGDWDIWLHERVGSDLLDGGAFPSTNTYSFSEPGHPWTNHEWLFQVMIALTGSDPVDDEAAAVRGWSAVRVLMVTGLLLVVLLGDGGWRRFRQPQPVEGIRLWLGLPLLLGVMLIWSRLILRPELVSYIFLVLVVRQAEGLTGWPPVNGPPLGAPKRQLLLAILTVIAWAQFHGFAAVAPLIWMIAIVSGWLQRRLIAPTPSSDPRRADTWTWALLALVGSLAALLATPNGLTGLLYPLRALGQFTEQGLDLRSTISELTPLLDTPAALHLTILAYKLSLVWLVIWIVLSWGRISLLRILLVVATAVLAFQGQRNLGIYGVAFLLLHTGTVSANRPLWWRRWTRWRVPAALNWIGLVLTLAVVAIWSFQVVSHRFYLAEGVSRRFGVGLTPAHYPTRIVDALATSPRFRVLTNIDPAGYVLSGTRGLVFIDGRTEAYSPDTWRLYETLKRGDHEAGRTLANLNPDRVLLSIGTSATGPLIRMLLAHPQWQVTGADESALLFQRQRHEADSESRDPDLIQQVADLEKNLLAQEPQLDPVLFADRCLAIGELWGLLDQVGREADLLHRARLRAPAHPNLLHNAGTGELEAGRFADALPLLEKAVALNPRLVPAWVNQGVCLARLGQLARARDAFARAVAVDRRSFDGWANLGSMDLALDDRPAALAAFKQALALSPGNERIASIVAELQTAGF